MRYFFLPLGFAVAVGFALLSDGSSYELALLVTAAVFLVCGSVAGYSAAPVEFGAHGSRFSNLREDIDTDREFLETIVELGEFKDEDIEDNDTVMKKNQDLMYLSYWMCVMAPITGVVSHLLFK